MNKISNLIFDIGGVIILQPKQDWSLEDCHLGLKEGTIKGVFDDCFSKRAIDKNLDEEAYFQERYSDLLSWDEYQKVLSKFFAGEEVNTPLVEWIQDKKSAGYWIYALTNNTAVLNKLLKEKFKINHIFDRIFNSAETGLAKPDPKFFDYLLKEIKATPIECLFVDDNSKNVETASQLGFNSVLFKDNKNFFEKINKNF